MKKLKSEDWGKIISFCTNHPAKNYFVKVDKKNSYADGIVSYKDKRTLVEKFWFFIKIVKIVK